MSRLDLAKTERVLDFWGMSDRELATQCILLAESPPDPRTGSARAEAVRLLLLWRDAIQSPCGTLEEREQRTALVAGVRKRTIQILVHMSIQGVVFIP